MEVVQSICLLACLFFQDRVSPLVAYAFNLSTREAEACRFLSLGQLGVQSYIGTLCLKRNKFFKKLMFVNYGIIEHWGKNRLLKFARTVRHVARMVLHLPHMHEFNSQYPIQLGVDYMSVILVLRRQSRMVTRSGSSSATQQIQGQLRYRRPYLKNNFQLSKFCGKIENLNSKWKENTQNYSCMISE